MVNRLTRCTYSECIDPSQLKNMNKYKFLCVIDFETTFEERETTKSFVTEIVEIAAVLTRFSYAVEAHLETVSQFHQHVRPLYNPKLPRGFTTDTGLCRRIFSVTTITSHHNNNNNYISSQ